ncbi:serine/threonine-protein kinase [Tsukamurella pseudospumae]|nr:serine/threonine-protein kinase [Tsukamurella pseudospumae]
MNLEPGTQFAGYRVVDEVGRGGMGQVFLVENDRLQRLEAMKLMAVGSTDAQFLRRFATEARTAAGLDHPGIITVYDYGVTRGVPWYTMRYIPDAVSLDGSVVEPRDVMNVLGELSEAIDYAHSMGVVHRDIKPANIAVSTATDGSIARVTLLDFGISRVLDETRMTSADAVVGSAAYLAPELVQGGQPSAASDQYALACTVYQYLSGAPLFRADSVAALLYAQAHADPRPLTGAAGPLDTVVRRALSKDPTHRYETCTAFSDAFAGAVLASQAPTEFNYAQVARGAITPEGAAGTGAPSAAADGQLEPAKQPAAVGSSAIQDAWRSGSNIIGGIGRSASRNVERDLRDFRSRAVRVPERLWWRFTLLLVATCLSMWGLVAAVLFGADAYGQAVEAGRRWWLDTEVVLQGIAALVGVIVLAFFATRFLRAAREVRSNWKRD